MLNEDKSEKVEIDLKLRRNYLDFRCSPVLIGIGDGGTRVLLRFLPCKFKRKRDGENEESEREEMKGRPKFIRRRFFCFSKGKNLTGSLYVVLA